MEEPAPPGPRADLPAESPATAKLPSATAPAPSAAVHFEPRQIDTTASGVFTVALVVDHADDLTSAQMRLQFDPKILQLSGVEAGGLLAVDGQAPALIKNVRNESGSADVEILRTPGTPGVKASGLLCVLRFQAVGKGTAKVAVPNLVLRNSQGQAIGTYSPEAMQ